jgi:hypothetical protein
MSKHPQKIGMKGSLKWIQKLVNDNPHRLNSGIRSLFNLNDSEAIEWLSPLEDD